MVLQLAVDSDDHIIDEEVSRMLSSAEVDGIKAALLAIDDQRCQLEAEGLSKPSFFLGSLNVIATTYVLARYPEWLWVMYCIKCLVLIPAWIFKMSKHYHGALFILDFCWVINISFCAYMLASLFGAVPADLQRPAFLIFFACSLGPLGWACIVLHNGLIYHSLERIASLFIHMTPALVTWTLVSYNSEVARVWPHRFPLADELRSVTAVEVYLHGLAIYSAWLVLHGLWLLSVGVNCPDRGHNTVFDDLYKKHGLAQVFEQKMGLKGIRSHAALYLFMHGLLVAVTFGWAALCFKFPIVHLIFALALVSSAAWNGAGYYEYIFARKYTKVVQKMLQDRVA